jgi:signal recognition particle subunit SRP54
MFRNLGDSFNKIFDKIKGKGVLSEKDIDDAMREIRLALLEADVSLKVIKQFTSRVKERAEGQEVVKSIRPGQMVVKIVQDEIENILTPSEGENELNLSSKAPNSILMLGLQGSGKTTTCGKLANKLKRESSKNILLVSLDTSRPAAVEQLQSLAEQVGAQFYDNAGETDPVKIASAARDYASRKDSGIDTVIYDTAGRMQVDSELMDELVGIKSAVKPDETLLVLDALTGQEAVNIAEEFSAKLDFTGTVLTRLDGDSRGGAALSVSFITERPVKFSGVGEKITDLDKFNPASMASQILDMGDVTSLVEEASKHVEEKDAKRLQKRMQKGKFDFNDLQMQLNMVDKMGGMSSMLKALPGMNKMQDKLSGMGMDESKLKRQEAIILSMNKKERKNPKLLNASRKRRIAAGSGNNIQEVNKLIKQHEKMQKMLKKVSKMDKKGMLKDGGLNELFS